jgi:DNA-binding MarR family transcriptional regulator
MHNVAVAASESTAADLLRAYLDAVALSETLLSRLWHDNDLTLVQLCVLRKLARGDRALGELGSELSLSPTSITRLIDRLEERGLVARKRSLDDRRRVDAVLLSAGRDLVGAVPFIEGSDLKQAANGMPAADRSRMTSAFRDFVAAVRRLEQQAVTGRP